MEPSEPDARHFSDVLYKSLVTKLQVKRVKCYENIYHRILCWDVETFYLLSLPGHTQPAIGLYYIFRILLM